MDQHRLLGMALSFVPGMNASFVRHLEESGVGLEEFFSSGQQELAVRLNVKVNPMLDRMVRDEALFKAMREVEFMERHGIM
ncbi:MAG: hypothetical protein K2L00_01210, partial [Muribaculaceae bacterium]|nr:hypothetical protein [Muribaculaceae bacterium]